MEWANYIRRQRFLAYHLFLLPQTITYPGLHSWHKHSLNPGEKIVLIPGLKLPSKMGWLELSQCPLCGCGPDGSWSCQCAGTSVPSANWYEKHLNAVCAAADWTIHLLPLPYKGKIDFSLCAAVWDGFLELCVTYSLAASGFMACWKLTCNLLLGPVPSLKAWEEFLQRTPALGCFLHSAGLSPGVNNTPDDADGSVGGGWQYRWQLFPCLHSSYHFP